ncbi:Fic family protein [Methanospirillum sp.]
MSEKKYRIENKNGKSYLVKDIQVNNKKNKVYLRLDEGISPDNIEEKGREYLFNLEIKAIEKKASISAKTYKSRYFSPDLIQSIEIVRFLYQVLMDYCTISERDVYAEKINLNYIHGTTAIEGNTLSYSDVENLMKYGILPEKRKLREVNEVQNFAAVLKYRNEFKGKVNKQFILKLHELIMNNIDRFSAGVFRRNDETLIYGEDLTLCPSLLIEEELDRIVDEYYHSIKDGYYPFETAVMFHYNFETIHPFTDGNGRVGREILNYMLSNSGYPTFLVLGKHRESYLDALRAGNIDKFGEMVIEFAKLLINQYSEILKGNLHQVTSTPRREGQSRLTDFM